MGKKVRLIGNGGFKFSRGMSKRQLLMWGPVKTKTNDQFACHGVWKKYPCLSVINCSVGQQEEPCHLEEYFWACHKCWQHSQWWKLEVLIFSTILQHILLKRIFWLPIGGALDTNFYFFSCLWKQSGSFDRECVFDLNWCQRYQAHSNWSDCSKFVSCLAESHDFYFSLVLRHSFLFASLKNFSFKQYKCATCGSTNPAGGCLSVLVWYQ